ncbi:MAG: hypothetical protein JKY81_04710 [Colwellia sp.]|nr:hypothetical protein [Colwellia sp.]
MIDKLIKWAANKRGFFIEKKSGLVLIHHAKDTTQIKMATMEYREGQKRLSSLEGQCILPGDTLKVYINIYNEGGK